MSQAGRGKSRRACFSPSLLPPLNVNFMNPVYVTKCHYFPLLARGACISRRIYICCVPEAIRNKSVCAAVGTGQGEALLLMRLSGVSHLFRVAMSEPKKTNGRVRER